MSNSFRIQRRRLLLTAGAAPLAVLSAAPVLASAAQMAIPTVDFRRFRVGQFEVTTLLAGMRTVDNPQAIFGMNVSEEDFADASTAANIPTNAAQFFFTPTLVNTGADLVLFDTGLNPAGITAAIGAAGYTPDQVDIVVLTHMHGDHIGGLSGDMGVTFPNASYVTGAVEFDHWAAAGNDGFDAKVAPLAEKMRMISGGDAVVSGIEAVEAFGHTPGHMAFRIDSDGQSLLIAADFANHYVWSLAYPTWEVKFDRDKEAAAATRQSLLTMLAAEKMPFVGYHMPFPALGYAEERAGGFHYVPHSYQLLMGG
ncbi:MBL fold metallo-hydrolase [Aliiroseovarius lamellibrachiae]|uniref:MBL fold metallo-hydrolase n=1 Tax=Aliiroseovarius lamellibrachiae TaxID=1924933 RepID=UPI001BE0574F|nr:MBL fold metallo-hydrolase [Aliiroseovarius lamellibrachiae]MBT2129733.1 MBL fold metallo-hydrolase [Aliiroseovarius lamellibrachiae]